MNSSVEHCALDRVADFRKIGGKDFQAVGGQGYSQSGVCSYVYCCGLRGDSEELALKVMLNYDTANDTVALSGEFDAETAILSDPERLPPHRHIMAVFHSFADDATSLPGWDFDPTIVMARTMMVSCTSLYSHRIILALRGSLAWNGCTT